MLEAQALEAYYGESRVLRRVGLSVKEGEVVAILGRNGVGKTTLLKTLVGQLPCAAGRINFVNKDVTNLPSFQRARLGMGYVPQGREIFPELTVEENLVLGAREKRGGGAFQPIFALFPVLQTMLKRRGGDLSGGQQQQLAIARALLSKPKLLILDEPTEGIQPSVVEEIAAVLFQLKQEGQAILLVEQYLAFARSISDRYYVMDRGRVVEEGSRETFDMEKVKKLLSV